MAAVEHYVVTRLADGTKRTVSAQSVRGAMRIFIANYGPPIGEDFRVSVCACPGCRGRESYYEHYRTTHSGIRRLPD